MSNFLNFLYATFWIAVIILPFAAVLFGGRLLIMWAFSPLTRRWNDKQKRAWLEARRANRGVR
jgi:hypothetical protein